MLPLTSSAPRQVRLCWPDAVAALSAPVLARLLRDFDVLTTTSLDELWLYVAVTTGTTLAFLSYFRIGGIMGDHLCSADLRRIAKAATLGVLAGVLIIFTLNRLDQIPRSMPALQIVVLLVMLSGWRLMLARAGERVTRLAEPRPQAPETVLLVGANKMASMYIRMAAALDTHRPRIVGLLDADRKLHGHSVAGYPIVGDWSSLERVVSEYATHGIRIDRTIVMVTDSDQSRRIEHQLKPICSRLGISFDLWADHVRRISSPVPEGLQIRYDVPASSVEVGNPFYWVVRRVADVVLSLSALIALSPVILLTAVAVAIDVGAPVIFWQDRLGRHGRSFRLYKFRSLRAPFARNGARLSDDERLSGVGRWLRATRLDELPQLVNILRGDMTIIGPRPLLPVDMPADDASRLAVPPGLTGWAQVNGGKLITPEEKNQLDKWYVRNCGPALDLKILFLTFLTLLRGDSRDVYVSRGAAELAHER